MEEIPSSLKRQREEEEKTEEIYKRQKSYKDITTLLEEEEEEDPTDDLSSLISTLQDEISNPGSDPAEPENEESDPVQTGPGSGVEEVMKHLLEASDDELGIPNNYTSGNSSSVEMDGCDLFDGGHVDGGDLLFSLGDGLWEFEDHEAANYYNMLQSDNFI